MSIFSVNAPFSNHTYDNLEFLVCGTNVLHYYSLFKYLYLMQMQYIHDHCHKGRFSVEKG